MWKLVTTNAPSGIYRYSKYEILQRRIERAEHELDKLKSEVRWLDETEYHHNDCAGCGQHFETEADFAKHFVVTDDRYLNLGECPVAKNWQEVESCMILPTDPHTGNFTPMKVWKVIIDLSDNPQVSGIPEWVTSICVRAVTREAAQVLVTDFWPNATIAVIYEGLR